MSGESGGEAFETPTAPKDNAQVNITEVFCNGLLLQTNIEKGYDKYARIAGLVFRTHNGANLCDFGGFASTDRRHLITLAHL